MATVDEELAELRAIPPEALRPRSIHDRWADAEQASGGTPPAAGRFSEDQAAAEPDVLEDPDPARVPYGTTF